MSPDQDIAAADTSPQPLRWAWVAGGVLLGSILVSLFVYMVDPQLERPAVTGLVVTLSLILVGILVGYRSSGETIRETAIAGLIILILTAIVAAVVLNIRVPVVVWLMSPFYAAILTMAGGWVGEMLQGTLEEAHEDKAIDWPWVFVSIIIGFTNAEPVRIRRQLPGHRLDRRVLFTGRNDGRAGDCCRRYGHFGRGLCHSLV